MRYFAGIDPDCHTLPIALVDETLRVTSVDMIRTKGDYTNMLRAAARRDWVFGSVTAFAVEAQELYLGDRVNPRDILHVAQVAGAVFALCCQGGLDATSCFPRPAEWKGQIDKLPHHRRILRAAGIDEQYWVPMGGTGKNSEPYMALAKHFPEPWAAGLNPGDYKHVVDAIGLAQWAATTYLQNQRKQELLARVRQVLTPGT